MGGEFFYTLQEDILRISYLKTSILKLNYITSNRLANSSTQVSLDTSNNSGENTITTKDNSGVEVSINASYDFWKGVEQNIREILGIYSIDKKNDKKKPSPFRLVIDKASGTVLIRANKEKLTEVNNYLDAIRLNITKQVLIDINIYRVTLDDSHQTGIDWQQISNLQNFTGTVNVQGGDGGAISTININKTLEIDSLLSFISSYGNTNAISNPRILAINNQTAVISIGRQIYYKLVKSTTTQGSTTTSSQDEKVQSIFAGIIVDITPSISKDNEIILRINKSISDTNQQIKKVNSGTIRTIPPDLQKQELSTVVKVKNEEKIVLGGLIKSNKGEETSGIKGLSKIPFIGFLFGVDKKNDLNDELVIVITPKVIEL